MQNQRFVSRGGVKLEAAIKGFQLNVRNKVCADVGAAHGGFTQALLEGGAKRVYAIEKGKGLLDWKLRTDPRVVVMEKVNVLDLPLLPEKADLVTIDTSWTRLEMVLPVIKAWLNPKGLIAALFKPQYQVEVNDKRKLREGIVTSERLREQTLHNFLKWCRANRWSVLKQMQSPITGGKKGKAGNIEYLLLLQPYQEPSFG